MFMLFPALVNALLGLLGIALARRLRSQSRLMRWLMAVSGIVLCVPLALLLIEQASAFNVIGGHGRRGPSLFALWRFLSWARWSAYALLLLGFVRLRIAQRQAAGDMEARRPAGEPANTQRPETATIEAVVGGAMVTLLVGSVGVLAGSAQAAKMGSASEFGAFLSVASSFLGLGLGLACGVVAGRRASRSGVGAHPRFWLPVFAALLGALASGFVLTFVLPTLLSLQPYASRYGYYKSSISQVALVFPFVCGFAGYLVSLRMKRGFTGWFVLGCLLLTLAVVTALPINTGRAGRRAPHVAVGPSFLRYPGATARPGPQYTRAGTGTACHYETEDSRESVITFYRKTLADWRAVPARETGAVALAFEGKNGGERATIYFEDGATGKTSFSVIYETGPGRIRDSLQRDSTRSRHLPGLPR